MSTSSDAQSAFARHSLGEQSRQQQEQQQPSTGPNKDAHPLGQMSFTARLLVFILIPTFTGLSKWTHYLKKKKFSIRVISFWLIVVTIIGVDLFSFTNKPPLFMLPIIY